MSDKTQGVTARALIEFHRILLREIAENFGGDITLNEIRIMNQIILCSVEGRTCYVTALHKMTGIPIPTVSRTVAKLQNKGWLSERRDFDDGRKRQIFLGPRSVKQIRDEINGKVQWFKEFQENAWCTPMDMSER